MQIESETSFVCNAVAQSNGQAWNIFQILNDPAWLSCRKAYSRKVLDLDHLQSLDLHRLQQAVVMKLFRQSMGLTTKKKDTQCKRLRQRWLQRWWQRLRATQKVMQSDTSESESGVDDWASSPASSLVASSLATCLYEGLYEGLLCYRSDDIALWPYHKQNTHTHICTHIYMYT